MEKIYLEITFFYKGPVNIPPHLEVCLPEIPKGKGDSPQLLHLCADPKPQQPNPQEAGMQSGPWQHLSLSTKVVLTSYTDLVSEALDMKHAGCSRSTHGCLLVPRPTQKSPQDISVPVKLFSLEPPQRRLQPQLDQLRCQQTGWGLTLRDISTDLALRSDNQISRSRDAFPVLSLKDLPLFLHSVSP